MSTARIDPLTKDNYETWAIQAEAVLVRNHLWKFIETSLKSDATEAELYGDRQAKSELILIISPSELTQIKKCNTAKDVWDRLKDVYKSKGPARKATLLKQLILTKLKGQDVQAHLKNFMEIVNRLEELEVDINEDLLSILMLYSLSEDYENFRVAIESRDCLPKPEELKIKILEEWEARHSHHSFHQEPESLPQEGALMIVTCKYCKRRGNKIFKHKHHKICTDCWKKNKNKTHKTSENANINHFVAQCLLTHNKKSENNIWVLDSGCTSHMTYRREFFKTIETTTRKLNFATDEYTTEIKGKGKVSFVTKTGSRSVLTHLEDTLYVPSLSTNLISVSKITDHGCTVTFTKHKATVNNPKFGITITATKRRDGLYYIEPIKHEYNHLANNMNDGSPIKRNNTTNIIDWHKKLGHMNEKDMKYALKNEKLIGLNFDISEALPECETCIQAKLHTVSSPSRTTTQRTSEHLEIVHSDVCGPVQTPTLSGNKYFVTFIDDYSRYCRVYFIKNKSDVLEKFKEFKELAETQTGKKIKYLQSDNGTEYINTKFETYLKNCGIQRRLSAPYTPNQNGIAERKNRTLLEKARSMMIDAKVPLRLWGEALATANYLSNRSVNSAIEYQTPFERWVGRRPCINHLYTFGNKTYVLKKGHNGHKFAAKAISGVFVGYSETSKAFKIFIPSKNNVIISKDIRVMKTQYFDDNNLDADGFMNLFDENTEDITSEPKHIPSKQIVVPLNDYTQSNTNSEFDETLQRNAVSSTEQILQEEQTNAESDYESPSNSFIDHEYVHSDNIENDVNVEIRPLRDRSQLKVPTRYDDFILAAADEIENLYKPTEPLTYKEAINSVDRGQWQNAMLNEIQSLNDNQTWDLVNLPKGRKALPCKWIYKIKMNPDGSVERYKARLVIKGYSQEPGVDFDKTFSPVVRLSTIRTLLAVAARENLNLIQFDVSTAFLYGDIKEEIYMKQPEGYQDGTKRVCKLNHSLYGLKQAPRCWNSCVTNFLKESGFHQSEADPCLYIRNKGESKVFIGLYVDDGLVAYNTNAAGDSFIRQLKAKFKITTKPASYFLGMEINEQKGKSITLCQKAYTKKILEKYIMSNCKPAPTPIIKDNEIVEDDDFKYNANFPYRQAVGALAYLSVGTRPDISYAVGVASRNLESPTKKDIMLVKRIFRYLKGTLHYGLTYTKMTPPKILCYSDADHGGDQTTGRSTSGSVFVFSGAAISWRSQKQATVSISSTEAEIIAASETSQEILWLNRLLSSFTITEKPVLYLDNESAVKLAENPQYEYHKRTKHIKLKHFFVRECVTNGEFNIRQIPSESQLADMLTKPLFGPRLKELSSKIGLKNL